MLKKLNLNSSKKEMATHSSTLAWKIPCTEEPGRLQSMGSLRVGHDWATSLSLFTPIMKGHLFWMLVLKGLIGVHRTIQLQLLQHYCLGHRLGSLWYWMVCLGKEQRSFCHFWDCIQVLHFKLFCWPWWLSISSKGFLPTVVDIMVIWVKFTHSSPF